MKTINLKINDRIIDTIEVPDSIYNEILIILDEYDYKVGSDDIQKFSHEIYNFFRMEVIAFLAIRYSTLLASMTHEDHHST